MRPTQDRSGPVERRLRVALDANAAAYRRAVRTSAPGECWDYLVLTAANEKQAEGYRQELALRTRSVGPAGAFFPEIQRTLVVADPSGARIGSGGATLGVMRALFRHFKLDPDDLGRLRVLLIHSGGMSQRLPMYSPLGKIFAPLPMLRPDGQIATLFDHLYLTLAGLPDRLGPGILMLAGDVFLVFDHRHVTAPPPGVTAISMRVDSDLGRGHGVFVTGKDRQILRTLQKVSVDEMAACGATDAAGRVLIDTGLLFFDPERLRTLHAMARQIRADTPIDLYDDMTAALAADTERDAYLRGGASVPLRRRLWKRLHGVPFGVTEVAGEFLHLGTTRQFRDAMTGRDPSPAAALFQQNLATRSGWDLPTGARVYQSVLSRGFRPSSVGEGSLIEHSVLTAPWRIGRGSVVSQVVDRYGQIRIGQNLLLFQVPVKMSDGATGYANVLCGMDDDFKGTFAEGRCSFFNRPIGQWFRRHRISPERVWRGVPCHQRTLWNARLFPVTKARYARSVLSLAPRRTPGPLASTTWAKFRRVSMADILDRLDPAALIADREVVWARLQVEQVLEHIWNHSDLPADMLVSHYATREAYDEFDTWLIARGQDRLWQARGRVDYARALWTAAQVLQRPGHPSAFTRKYAKERAERLIKWAFQQVADASEPEPEARRAPLRKPRRGRLRPGLTVTASAPVRLDLAGGWTDTPPYCFERGGHVVNVAIDLDGGPPVTATVETLPDPVIVVESHDLGQKITLVDDDTIGSVDVHDPFALHKVALRTAGLVPDDSRSLTKHLKMLGGGLRVTTEALVPKGSGLGTSSILTATLLAALRYAVGTARAERASSGQLISQTLLVEQRLSTGGGWQDQVGGVAPAVKSTTSAPGIPQRPDVEVLKMSNGLLDAFQDRLVVYYSGQQRLARDILRQVMGRWLGREPAVLALMDGLKQSAAALRAALLRGRWTIAARQMNRYWQIKKDLYAGSTTPAIDLLFLEMEDDYLAAGLAGAGGGGFAYFLCRDRSHAARLRQRLAEHSARPGSMGSVYATQINRTGLRVTKSRDEPET